MDHQHTADQNSKEHANHSMNDMNPRMGMQGHDHHKMMIADFKRRFYITSILTVPIMLLSHMIQQWLGIEINFKGSQYILFVLSWFRSLKAFALEVQQLTKSFIMGSAPFV